MEKTKFRSGGLLKNKNLKIHKFGWFSGLLKNETLKIKIVWIREQKTKICFGIFGKSGTKICLTSQFQWVSKRSRFWPTQNIAKFGKYLTASEIQYYLEFQEYSNMSETGFASIRTTRKVGNCDFFLELNTGHTSVDFTQPIFKNIFNINQKSNNLVYTHEYSCGYINENGAKCNGKLKLGELIQFLTIPFNVDLELLEMMFNEHFYHSHSIDFENNEAKCFMNKQKHSLNQYILKLKRIHGITNEWEVTAYLSQVQKRLGQYLNSKYLHLTPIEHLQYIYKLYQNIDKNKELSSEICSVMYIVSNLNTQNEVLKILHKIRNCDESGTTGISSVFSKMDHVIWSQTPNNINARESAYANVNHDGCNLFLFAGIVRERDFDKKQWESIDVGPRKMLYM
ncbi:hypothetical protein RhiirA4_481047 [Rhizophagus irregularis]|uniref:Uncharacterized protein n=1 Tax=Rhizophagus irregularis TaxID=588596 RepID=A0A2I1HIY1_9GLOM|nr:hypothetical protein RhiirA4_481047 [Rhizophagus irregularis]